MASILCQCPHANPNCCNGKDKAIFEVRRGEERLLLCSHCDFSTDTDRRLIENFTMDELKEQDILGWFVVMLEIAEATNGYTQ